MSPPPPRPPPALPEEIVEEVLLRFPPDDPARLVRAALICKTWCRLVSGRRFRRRFREFHRSAPMLGLICNFVYEDGSPATTFDYTSSFRKLYDEHHRWRALDARHGRVLLTRWSSNLAVWDPVADEWWDLPGVPSVVLDYSAAVLRAGTPSGTCDHLDCHGRPFLVVLVFTVPAGAGHMCARIYSSQAGSWSQPTTFTSAAEGVDWHPTALVGDTLYFLADMGRFILSFDLATQETSLIHLPTPQSEYEDDYDCYIATALMEGYGMVVAVARVDVEEGRLSLLSMVTSPAGDIEWAQTRVVDLNKLLPANALSVSSFSIAFAPGTVFLVGTDHGIFSIDLKSDQAKKVLERNHFRSFLPYMSFYTPGRSLLDFYGFQF